MQRQRLAELAKRIGDIGDEALQSPRLGKAKLDTRHIFNAHGRGPQDSHTDRQMMLFRHYCRH